MTNEEYMALQKRAEKDSAADKTAGRTGFLPCLDDLLEGVDVSARVNLGIISIPIDRIAGTDNAARANAFSPSFLPLLEPTSEFANKYMRLYESCEEEGLREPIIGFEYLGKYYIREGNKRVSVCKQLGLKDIEGSITRIIPVRTDNPEVIINYEYINFYDSTQGINFLDFSKASSYKKFYEMVAGGSECFSEEQRMDVYSLYYRFRGEYFKKSKTPPISVSDALFTYVSLVGYDEVKDKSGSKIHDDIERLWKEFKSHALPEAEAIAVSEKPLNKEPNLIKKIALQMTSKKLKIAFVHMGNIENSAWVYSHELGRQYLEEDAFQGEIDTDSFYDVSIEDAESVLEDLCAKKYNVIFSTSAQHASACTKVAIKHPGVKILNCSLNDSTKFVRTYYIRTYECKYLLGMIAGAMTQTGKIAYVADYPVYGTIASLNAFALGVSTTNSSARVYLTWYSKKDADSHRDINEAGCDIISNLDWSSPRNLTKKFGLYADEENPVNLAAPLWDWGKLYEEIVRGIKKGVWDLEEDAIGKHTLSYWWGISAGAVDLIYSNKVPTQTLRLIKYLKDRIQKSDYHIFSGELKFQDGVVMDADPYLTYMDLIEMDKLLWNIIGEIPLSSQLKDETVSLAKVQGVLEKEE